MKLSDFFFQTIIFIMLLMLCLNSACKPRDDSAFKIVPRPQKIEADDGIFRIS